MIGKIEKAVPIYYNTMQVVKKRLTRDDGSEKGYHYIISFDGYRKEVK